MAFTISHAQQALICEHARREYPREACGVLLGRGPEVAEVITCTNEVHERNDRFRIPPAELFAAQKRARLTGTEIVGFYHSHPDHRAQPSATDVAEAHWFGCLYLIVSVENGVPGQMRAFLLEGDEANKHFRELAIHS